MRREESRRADLIVLDELEINVPRTAREIQQRLYVACVNEWAEQEGIDPDEIEWTADGYPVSPGVRLCAVTQAKFRGEYLSHEMVYNRLIKLERMGAAERIMISKRTILWRRREVADALLAGI